MVVTSFSAIRMASMICGAAYAQSCIGSQSMHKWTRERNRSHNCINKGLCLIIIILFKVICIFCFFFFIIKKNIKQNVTLQKGKSQKYIFNEFLFIYKKATAKSSARAAIAHSKRILGNLYSSAGSRGNDFYFLDWSLSFGCCRRRRQRHSFHQAHTDQWKCI